MTHSPSIQLHSTDLHVLMINTRMPFKYGIATLTRTPHLFVSVQAEIYGQRQQGVAADNLPPKWFTKDPQSSFQADLAEMVAVIRSACRLAAEVQSAATIFDFWWQLYQAQAAWGAAQGYPPLLWNFGVSLVERALIDAFCRAQQTPFALAVRSNHLGIDLGHVHPALAGRQPAEFLPPAPLTELIARHTVGLSDPLRDRDIPAAERVDDGLPQSLAACVAHYGLTHFKIKVNGDPTADLARLREIRAVLDETTGGHYAFTLDGNEQFKSVERFQTFWAELRATMPSLLEHLIFVEQPFHRDLALSDEVKQVLTRWQERPPIIVDESDGSLAALPRALECGYYGSSHKNCKGIFKGLANFCLIQSLRQQHPAHPYIMSGEDLTNIGPVALLQDLAVLATLGIDHAERNGHHYFAGLSMLPPALQAEMQAAHGDLYQAGPGFPTLAITDGKVALQSITQAPFGLQLTFDPAQFMPLDDTIYEKLSEK